MLCINFIAVLISETRLLLGIKNNSYTMQFYFTPHRPRFHFSWRHNRDRDEPRVHQEERCRWSLYGLYTQFARVRVLYPWANVSFIRILQRKDCGQKTNVQRDRRKEKEERRRKGRIRWSRLWLCWNKAFNYLIWIISTLWDMYWGRLRSTFHLSIFSRNTSDISSLMFRMLKCERFTDESMMTSGRPCLCSFLWLDTL